MFIVKKIEFHKEKIFYEHMIIGGLQKFTLLDYPGKISAIIFTKGCNLRCPYCHNPELVNPKKIDYLDDLSEEAIFEFLRRRKGDLDGVCITGGEPTLQIGLSDFVKKIRNMGFLVKLDTNGTQPGAIKCLLDGEFVDYWAIDVKTSPIKYKIMGADENAVKNIETSINLIAQKNKKLELRTTVVRGLVNEDDVDIILSWLDGINKSLLPNLERFSLQEFRPYKTLNAAFRKVPAYPRETLEKMAEKIRLYTRNVIIMSE